MTFDLALIQGAFAAEPPPDFDKEIPPKAILDIETKPSLDTGLAQSLRQQLSSECYGFVEQSSGQIRGFAVNESFQLLRDGYPWARFDATANLMVAREEVLVGGPGQGCAFTPPGGLVNLVTRRSDSVDQPKGHVLLEADQYGTLAGRIEENLKPREDIGIRLAAKQQRYRNAARNIEDFGDVAANVDYWLTAQTKIRWDLQLSNIDANNGLSEPALFSQPRRISRTTNREQPWARYTADNAASLLAVEHQMNDSTLVKLGMSNVRYSGDWHSFYLDPQVSGQPILSDYVYPNQNYRFDAWQAELNKVAMSGPVQHKLRVAYTLIKVEMPDEVRPQQVLGLYSPGQVFPEVAALPATAARTLQSQESRFTLQDSMQWKDWTIRVGLQYAQLTDSNGDLEQSLGKWLPVYSVGWNVTPRLQLLATKSQGATGRQFSSITSATPNVINGIGISSEIELGLRYKGDKWELGLGRFDLTRPYQFEQQTVTVWRGEQHDAGWESTLQLSTADALGHVVLTAQLIDAEVTGTGDSSLDGKQPPGIPDKRASLYADYKLGKGSAWTVSLSAEAVSKRATFDDNQVFVAGYANWSAGLEWLGRGSYKNISTQLTIQNLANRYAWGDAGGGYAYPIDQRTAGLSLRFGL